MNPTDLERQLVDLTGLADPVRRALYRYVVERGAPVAREEAAGAVGISRALAAYHLDKLVDEALLQVRFERRTGRRGPGAGRPSKLYLRSGRQIELSVPARDYAALAELLAGAVEADPTGGARGALHAAARALGAELGAEAATPAAVRRLLASRGYEPFDEPDGTIRLRNCPFDRIAARHPELICGINLAILEGLVDQCGEEGTRAVLEPAPGRCCVALTRR